MILEKYFRGPFRARELENENGKSRIKLILLHISNILSDSGLINS